MSGLNGNLALHLGKAIQGRKAPLAMSAYFFLENRDWILPLTTMFSHLDWNYGQIGSTLVMSSMPWSNFASCSSLLRVEFCFAFALVLSS